MKPKNLRNAITHIKKLRDELRDFQNGKYEHSYRQNYMVGDFETNRKPYVQFVTKLEAYYYDENGRLQTMDMTNVDLRKLPQAMKNQLMGRKYDEDK